MKIHEYQGKRLLAKYGVNVPRGVVVTGHEQVPAAVEVMKDGASDVIQKPLSSPEISDKVRRALQASGRLTHDRCSGKPHRGGESQ